LQQISISARAKGRVGSMVAPRPRDRLGRSGAQRHQPRGAAMKLHLWRALRLSRILKRVEQREDIDEDERGRLFARLDRLIVDMPEEIDVLDKTARAFMAELDANLERLVY